MLNIPANDEKLYCSLFEVFVEYLICKSHHVQLNGNNFIFGHFIVRFYPHNFFITNAFASWALGGISLKMNLTITSLSE
jgi:hypothetical protein